MLWDPEVVCNVYLESKERLVELYISGGYLELARHVLSKARWVWARSPSGWILQCGMILIMIDLCA